VTPRLSIIRALWRILTGRPLGKPDTNPTPPPPVEVRSNLRARVYPILVRCVEDGVAYGWGRAHKHEDTPCGDTIRDAIQDAVLSELCEAFAFDDGEGA
jgi:hypothetical protein